MNTFYLPASGQVLNSFQLPFYTGFSPDADPEVLASNGIYTVVPTTDPYDPYLYATTATYTVAGNYANQSWVATPRDLTTGKQAGSNAVKATANNEESLIVGQSGLSPDLLTAVTGQEVVDRPTRFQSVLEAMATVSNQLDANLNAIDAATSVDEINNIVNPPTGFIYTGRGGSGGGPLDMNPSYLTSWVSISMDSTDTELYIPATMTTVPYDDSVPPYQYAQTFGAFTPGNYTVQIRQASTGLYISEWECPLSATEIPVEF